MFKCEQKMKEANVEMDEAEELGDTDTVIEMEDLLAKKKEQLDRHKETITGVFAEIDELDTLIAKVVARCQPLYTDPSLEKVAAAQDQRKRIEASVGTSKLGDKTGVWAPWKCGRSSPRGGLFARNPKEAAGGWEQVLPAYELERQVREVVARQQKRAERRFLEAQQEREADKARFAAGLAPELGNGVAAASGA
jgi:hypothetical protein